MKKTIISVTMVVIMIAVLAVPVLAAPADDVIASLDNAAAHFPGNIHVAKMLSSAKTWIAANREAITADAASIIDTQIAAALATVGSAQKLEELSTAQQNSVIANITVAANTVGLSFTADISGSNWTFTLRDAAGNIVANVSNRDPIKKNQFMFWCSGI